MTLLDFKSELQRAREENVDLSRRLEKSIAVFQGQETRMVEQKEEIERLNEKVSKRV